MLGNEADAVSSNRNTRGASLPGEPARGPVNALDVLYWDGTGLCLFAKRLAKGYFAAPWTRAGDGPPVLTGNAISAALRGANGPPALDYSGPDSSSKPSCNG